MKKGLIVVVGVAVVAALGVGGYSAYTKKAQQKAFDERMAQTISSLPPIVVYEKNELPSIEEEFAGTSDVIDAGTITPDISNVYTTEPGTYEVIYTFKDVNGVERTATVPCTVKPDLLTHVSGMQDLSIDAGDEVPVEAPCTFDEYVSSVTLDTSAVDTETPGVYDISYTILGASGEMQTADGYTCTVKALALSPTPTPTVEPTKAPKPTVTPKPKKKNKTNTEQQQEEQQTEQETEQTTEPVEEQETETTEVGNVTPTETAVQTGDENNVIGLVILIVVALGAAVGAVVYWRMKNKDKKL